MNTNQMTIMMNFTTAFITEHGSDKMLTLWNSDTTQKNFKKIMTSAKKFKDDNAPKRALSAYMYFCKDQREAVKKDMGDVKATEITTELGVRWNTLKNKHSDKKSKKMWDKYEEEATNDKNRYKDECDEYTPLTNSTIIEMIEEKQGKQEKKKSSSSTKKDTLAPKRNKTAYILFCAANRDIVKQDKTLANVDVTAKLCLMWKNIKTDSSLSNELKKYTKEADEDKKRYNEELKNYIPPENIEEKKDKKAKKAKGKPIETEPEYDSDETEKYSEEELEEEHVEEEHVEELPEQEPEEEHVEEHVEEPVEEPEEEPVKKLSGKKSSGKKSEKMSGKSLYFNEFRFELLEDYPDLNEKQIIKKLTEQWKNLPQTEKDDWDNGLKE
jgi:hypothetical protein